MLIPNVDFKRRGRGIEPEKRCITCGSGEETPVKRHSRADPHRHTCGFLSPHACGQVGEPANVVVQLQARESDGKKPQVPIMGVFGELHAKHQL